MTEIGTIMVFECSHQPGGTHIIEDHMIEEVIDPATLEPVAYGERGERVVTSFGRGAIPLIRYRTGDLVCKVPASRCACGRGFDIYEGGILGRVDDMKIVRGTNVYPRAIEAIVREFSEVDEFQTVITHEGIRDEITLRVEMKPDWPADRWDALCGDLHRRLVARPRGTELPHRAGRRRRAAALRAQGQADGRPARLAGGGVEDDASICSDPSSPRPSRGCSPSTRSSRRCAARTCRRTRTPTCAPRWR